MKRMKRMKRIPAPAARTAARLAEPAHRRSTCTDGKVSP
jgi:hypothetical protein